MGMSASQARLLSITSRLTNNEFRSQTITNSKLRLAQESESASAEYMDALNTQQLMFGSYSSDGKYTTTALTPALIYDYAPLKNQYALVNPSGKLLVSNVDAKNYEDSNTLYDFLDKYGLIGNSTILEQYNEDMKTYNSELDTYNELKADYDKKYPEWLEKYNKYIEDQNRPDLYTPFSEIVGTSDTALNDSSGAKFCYSQALNGSAGCYLHLLNYILDYNGSNPTQNDYTTTIGTPVKTNGQTGGMTDALTAENHKTFKEISDTLNSVECDGYDNSDYKNKDKTKTEKKYNLLKTKKLNGETITDLDRLRSDYIENDDGKTYSVKTLKQKAIDMYYIIQNSYSFKDDNGNTLITKSVMNEMLNNFTDGDMQKLSAEDPGEAPSKPNEPTKPTKPNIEIVLTDNDQAQWYVNLWHMMNGSDSSNKVKTNKVSYGTLEETVHSVENSNKDSAKSNYQVFEDMNLYKSSEWLQFALEHGMVTMYQAQYSNPSADSGKTAEITSEGITWKSIIYTNASDIISQDNETAIAIAEVKYKNAITEIENKDKKYDQDLKKLDTEHSALQTEYDSIKEVISKNTERSFKAFS